MVVVEFGDSHHDLLYSHLLLLTRAGYRPSLFLNEKLLGRFPNALAVETVTFPPDQGRLRTLRALLGMIRRLKATRMVLNTANGALARNLALATLPRPGLDVVGVSHYASKFRGSPTQWAISRKVRKYFVLSEIFFENGTLAHDTAGLTIQPLYAIHFPTEPEPSMGSGGDLRLVVPGWIQKERRDYDGLVRALARRRADLPRQLQVVILGDASTDQGRKLVAQVEAAGLAPWFRFFDGFVDGATFHAQVREADLMAPLLHPSEGLHAEFLVDKVSGSYNLGLGYRIPFLLDEAYRAYRDFRDVSVFYTLETLVERVCNVAADPEQLKRLREAYGAMTWLSVEEQTRRYAALLEA